MASVLSFTIVADGSSDRALVPILEWLLSVHLRVDFPYQINFADAGLPPLRDGLRARVMAAMEIFPADIMFVHRDAERESFTARAKEILQAVDSLPIPGIVPVVPVRMIEAWLLGSERSIRVAAGNSSGRIVLKIPKRTSWPKLVDPKSVLFEKLRVATELNGRRLQKFNVESARSRIAQVTEDFSYLVGLPEFDELAVRTRNCLQKSLPQD